VPAARPLLAGLLPAGVVAVDAVGDPPDGRLLPAEQPAVARAAARRVRDFAGGRHCARRAMAALGCVPGPLLAGSHGEPLWPAGVVGSLTHCEGYWAAAVARRGSLAALGIDAEPHLPLPTGVAGQVLTPAERDRLPSLPAGTSWDRVLFSAKESLFKAWFPVTRAWLGFPDAVVEPRPGDPAEPSWGELAIRLLRRPAPAPGCFPAELVGRYLVTQGLILTAVAVPD
jgi:4'-phosphopantetheinyl transferase EntD